MLTLAGSGAGERGTERRFSKSIRSRSNCKGTFWTETSLTTGGVQYLVVPVLLVPWSVPTAGTEARQEVTSGSLRASVV